MYATIRVNGTCMPTTQTNRPRYLKDLLLLFSVPAGVAILAASVVYVPRLFAKPGYDFIYSACTSYGCRGGYAVDSQGFVERKTSNTADRIVDDDIAELYYYSAEQDTAKRLTLAEARQYKLDTSLKSPDGYRLSHKTTESGFLFWGDYSAAWYLENGAKKKKVELTSNESYYAGDVKFLGWVSK